MVKPRPTTSQLRAAHYVWLMRRGAAWISRVVVVVASVGATVSATFAVLALVRHRPAIGVDWLVIPAVATLLLGQLWMIRCVRARTPDRRAGEPRTVDGTAWNPRDYFFGELKESRAYALLALAGAGWLLAMTAFGGQGSPTAPRDDCRFPLNNRGEVTCVTEPVYAEAGAAQQRCAAGILLAFYSLHLGAAAGALQAMRGGTSSDAAADAKPARNTDPPDSRA